MGRLDRLVGGGPQFAGIPSKGPALVLSKGSLRLDVVSSTIAFVALQKRGSSAEFVGGLGLWQLTKRVIECEFESKEGASAVGWLTYLYEPLASRMAGYIVSFAVVAGFSILFT